MATPAVITYAYIRGRWYAFPDTNSAREGVVKYNGNYQSIRLSRPVGAIIDEESLVNKNFWPASLANAPGVTGSALINPPFNPVQGPTPVTPTVTPNVTTTTSAPTVTSSASRSTGGGGGGEQGVDYYGGPKRTTGNEFLHGTNIRVSDVNANLRSNSGDAVYWDERIKNAGKDVNDVLFEMAFRMGDPKYTASGDITGQGNPFVGKLQSGQYRKTTGKTWAQEASGTQDSGETDAYLTRDDQGNVTGITEGKEWADQFKHSAGWERGDFSSGRARDDANMWKEKHMLAAGDDAAQKTLVRNRWKRMIGAD